MSDEATARRLAGLPDPDLSDPDNPEWTKADFARAKPLEAFPELAAALKRKPGRPRTSERQRVSFRLPREVVEHFKQGGAGWHTRVVDALERIARENR
jgi:uncharacterized protein (DUF4415 family)